MVMLIKKIFWFSLLFGGFGIMLATIIIPLSEAVGTREIILRCYSMAFGAGFLLLSGEEIDQIYSGRSIDKK